MGFILDVTLFTWDNVPCVPIDSANSEISSNPVHYF